jgi:hypothetical protein
MSPLYNDHFSGHMEGGDPRTPLTSAGGCVWPTVPAWRYKLSSDDATGVLQVLNWDSIIVQKDTPGIAHDYCNYTMIRGPFGIFYAALDKLTAPDGDGYSWNINIVAYFCGTLLKKINFKKRKCNHDFLIGNIWCPGYEGATGDTFRAEQVEFDHWEPPG